MVITTSSRSMGMPVKKLRRSNLFSMASMPVKTADPCIAFDTSFSMPARRFRVSSLSHFFRLSLSMDTNQFEDTSVPGYASPTPSISASRVTNSAIGGSSGSISTSVSGSSSSGTGSI